MDLRVLINQPLEEVKKKKILLSSKGRGYAQFNKIKIQNSFVDLLTGSQFSTLHTGRQ